MGKLATRFSGADWADQLREITLIGIGGIGSWLALNLARIGHSLILVDGDLIDQTNVNGGQLYRTEDIGKTKVVGMLDMCRELGCTNEILTFDQFIEGKFETEPIVITGLDNMKARKDSFMSWKDEYGDNPNSLFIDGRLLLETAEIFTVQGGDLQQMSEYEEKHLFSDEAVPDLDCTTKQSTFGAMLIASMITAQLCNFLTNRKLKMEFREVPFYQRIYLPLMDYRKAEVEAKVEIGEPVEEKQEAK